MDVTQARDAATRLLAASPPGVPDAVLSGGAEDQGWCWVLQWTTRRAMASGSPDDAPPPGIGPVAVDKATGEAFYLSSVPLPVALDMARAARGR
ncbi:hypothetical protein OG799_29855 [Micromonospora sp. NBC_00898]|uniref:hypothetical protein n=1 Tax=Micromonospora sp. NBC_00898 TaxID=2975981 RepID=UPI00386809D3|nr:hypothetical protein OG799_29855 [Micromonospora sp. NBC_00898]